MITPVAAGTESVVAETPGPSSGAAAPFENALATALPRAKGRVTRSLKLVTFKPAPDAAKTKPRHASVSDAHHTPADPLVALALAADATARKAVSKVSHAKTNHAPEPAPTHGATKATPGLDEPPRAAPTTDAPRPTAQATPTERTEQPRHTFVVTGPAPVLPPEELPTSGALLRHAANLTVQTEAGAVHLHLRVRDGVADVRLDPPALAAGRTPEWRQPELRVALAQEGLSLGRFDLGNGEERRARAEDTRAERLADNGPGRHAATYEET